MFRFIDININMRNVKMIYIVKRREHVRTCVYVCLSVILDHAIANLLY